MKTSFLAAGIFCLTLAVFAAPSMDAGAAKVTATASCTGVLAVVIGKNGPDIPTATQAKFTLSMKNDRTATMLLENAFAQPIKGTGKESGKADVPWNITAKDADGDVFKGTLKPIKATYTGDKALYMMLAIKSKKALITGLMTCTMK